MAAVRDRNTVRGTQTTEVVPLHRTGKTLTRRGARRIDELPCNEMVRSQLGADIDHVIRRNPELDHFALGLDLGDGKMATLGARRILRLLLADTQLKRCVAVLVFGPLRNDLALIDLQYRDGDMLPPFGEDPGHAQLLRDQS